MSAEIAERLAAMGADLSRFDAGAVGRWQRLPVTGKRGKPIAVKIHRTEPLLATIGDWRQGDFETVRDERHMPEEELGRLRAQSIRRRREAERETLLRQRAAREVAAKDLRAASPASAEHPYLVRKGVAPHRIYQWPSGELLIPMFDTRGELWSHQTIFRDGTKLYLKDGRRKGCYFPIGGAVSDLIVLCEGYATGASIFEATHWPVAVCFDAHGIKPAAEQLRRKLPRVRFLFAADDDGHLRLNIGLEAARAAAHAVGGAIVSPTFSDGDDGTDWNDYARHYGLDGVSWAFAHALEKIDHG